MAMLCTPLLHLHLFLVINIHLWHTISQWINVIFQPHLHSHNVGVFRNQNFVVQHLELAILSKVLFKDHQFLLKWMYSGLLETQSTVFS